MPPVESGMEEVEGETVLPSVEDEDWLPVPGIDMVVFKVVVPVIVTRLVIVEVSGRVELEKDDGSIGEPSVEDVLPPVGCGSVIV